MSDYRIQLQPAYVLHQRKYRETSLILDVFTEDFGIIPLLSKGVRKAKSRTAGLLQPFIPLAVSYLGKSEFKTLTHVEIISPAPVITGISLYCGLYLNELLKHLLHQHDPHPKIFNDYHLCLQKMSDGGYSIEAILRIFELNLLETIGYGLPLDQDCNNDNLIVASKRYHYIVDQGAYEASNGQFAGSTLIALRNKKLENKQALAEAKILMRKILDHQLAGKTLNSRSLFNNPLNIQLQ